MNLSRRDKIAVSLLGLAGIALALDRLVLPAPDTASAAQVSAELAATRSIDEILDAMPSSLPHRDFAPQEIPDVFDAARVEAARLLAQPPPTDVAEASRAALFQQRHRLTAVVLGPRPVALLGKRPLHIGDELDGFTLTAVSETAAVFVSDGLQVELRLARVGDTP